MLVNGCYDVTCLTNFSRWYIPDTAVTSGKLFDSWFFDLCNALSKSDKALSKPSLIRFTFWTWTGDENALGVSWIGLICNKPKKSYYVANIDVQKLLLFSLQCKVLIFSIHESHFTLVVVSFKGCRGVANPSSTSILCRCFRRSFLLLIDPVLFLSSLLMDSQYRTKSRSMWYPYGQQVHSSYQQMYPIKLYIWVWVPIFTSFKWLGSHVSFKPFIKSRSTNYPMLTRLVNLKFCTFS